MTSRMGNDWIGGGAIETGFADTWYCRLRSVSQKPRQNSWKPYSETIRPEMDELAVVQRNDSEEQSEGKSGVGDGARDEREHRGPL